MSVLFHLSEQLTVVSSDGDPLRIYVTEKATD